MPAESAVTNGSARGGGEKGRERKGKTHADTAVGGVVVLFFPSVLVLSKRGLDGDQFGMQRLYQGPSQHTSSPRSASNPSKIKSNQKRDLPPNPHPFRAGEQLSSALHQSQVPPHLSQ